MTRILATRKQRARDEGKEATFLVRGSEVSRNRIARFSKRRVVPQESEAVSLRSKTPEGIMYGAPSAEPLPQMFDEQSITYSTGFVAFAPTPDAKDKNRGRTLRNEESVQIAATSAQDTSQRAVYNHDDDRIFSPFTSTSSPSPSLSEDRSLSDVLQEREGILVKGDVPFTDSGYKSAPNPDRHQNSQHILEKSPRPFNVKSCAAEGSRSDEDAKTIYSIGTTVDSGYARKYIIELSSDIFGKLRQVIDFKDRTALSKVLPGLVKAFAIKLCLDSPSQANCNVMYFIHRWHREVAAQLEAMLNLDKEDELDRGHPKGMAVLDKMDLWNSKAGQDYPVLLNSDLFDGVKDDNEDPIN
ncbi:hypothetical protein BGZ57DRAFT_856298 [Hyaloscypha finlandica]|nr:hypothetical protein BGZ57DRAFT_856298 [Hyaloscypha finlandica]